MVALIILGVLAFIIALICLAPVGADIGYEDGELTVSAKVYGLLLQILPKKPKDDTEHGRKSKKEKKPKKVKPKKEKPKSEKPPKEKKPFKLNFTVDEIMLLLKRIIRKFGRFNRKFNVDRFLLHYLAAGNDPYKTATVFGYVNAGLSALAPQCEKRFNVRDCDVWTDIDFAKEKTEIEFGLAFTIRIGAFLVLGFGIAFAAAGVFIRSRVRLLFEKLRSKKGKNADNDNVISIEPAKEEIIKQEENIQAEERMNTNG